LSPAENQKPALTGAILAVEDEILIRLDTADYLRAQGFAVVEASNAHEAIILRLRDETPAAPAYGQRAKYSAADGLGAGDR
jgi:hypothetical protein